MRRIEAPSFGQFPQMDSPVQDIGPINPNFARIIRAHTDSQHYYGRNNNSVFSWWEHGEIRDVAEKKGSRNTVRKIHISSDNRLSTEELYSMVRDKGYRPFGWELFPKKGGDDHDHGYLVKVDKHYGRRPEEVDYNIFRLAREADENWHDDLDRIFRRL